MVGRGEPEARHVGAAFTAMRRHRPSVRVKPSQLHVLLEAETLLLELLGGTVGEPSAEARTVAGQVATVRRARGSPQLQ